MFISAPPRVFETKEKNFDDFEYENFETETNSGETGDIDDNFEEADFICDDFTKDKLPPELRQLIYT